MIRFILFACLCSFGFTQSPKETAQPKVPKSFTYIPSGLVQTPEGERSIQGFYMSKTEISNLEYRVFLDALKAAGRMDDHAKASPQPEGWEKALAYAGPFVQHYHSHPAYDHYPVVNISREGAELYCLWLTHILQAQHPDWRIQVRLPMELEWQYAARGGSDARGYPLGDQTRDKRGALQYHFKPSEVHAATAGQKATAPAQTILGPATCKSYRANPYGLYHLSGNVAEMLAESGRTLGGCYHSNEDGIRIDGPDEFAGMVGPSPFVGFRPLITVMQ